MLKIKVVQGFKVFEFEKRINIFLENHPNISVRSIEYKPIFTGWSDGVLYTALITYLEP